MGKSLHTNSQHLKNASTLRTYRDQVWIQNPQCVTRVKLGRSCGLIADNGRRGRPSERSNGTKATSARNEKPPESAASTLSILLASYAVLGSTWLLRRYASQPKPKKPSIIIAHKRLQDGQAALSERVLRRRCASHPSPHKPKSIIAQVEGSGTADTGELPTPSLISSLNWSPPTKSGSM